MVSNLEFFINDSAEDYNAYNHSEYHERLCKHIDNDEELKAICEVKQQIAKRGYAFVQIHLSNGEWCTIANQLTYETALNCLNRIKARYPHEYRVI